MLVYGFVVFLLAGCAVGGAYFAGCQWSTMSGVNGHSALNGQIDNAFDVTQVQCIAHGTIMVLTKLADGSVAEAICLDGNWYPNIPTLLTFSASYSRCPRPTSSSSQTYQGSHDVGKTWTVENSADFGDSEVLQQNCSNGHLSQSICLIYVATWAPPICNTSALYWPFVPNPNTNSCSPPTTTTTTTTATTRTTQELTTTSAAAMTTGTMTQTQTLPTAGNVATLATQATQATQPPPTTNQPQSVGKSGNSDTSASLAEISQEQQMPSQLIQQNVPVLTAWSGLNATQILQQCDSFAPYRASPPGPGPTLVTPKLAVDILNGIDTVGQTISVAGTLLMSWSTTCPPDRADPFTSRSAEEVYVASKDVIWTPAYRYINTAATNCYMQNHKDFGDDAIATITYGGLASQNRTLSFYWLKDGQFTSNCNLDLGRFPFDKQTCLFSFSFIRPINSLLFQSPDFVWNDQGGDDWDYVGQDIFLDKTFYKGQQTSTVHFSVTLKRNPTYYITNLVLPNDLLIIVGIGSFLLPPDLPDRPALSVTVLLALTVSQSTVMANVPRTAQRILLSDYVSGLVWLCVATTIYELFTCVWATRIANSESPGRKCVCCLGPVRVADLIAAALAIAAFAGLNAYLFVIGN